MLHIKNFFERFTKLAPPEKFIKETLREILLNRTGVSVDLKAMKVSNNIIYITESAVLKNEIFMQKREILEELKTILGHKAPRDVR